LREKKRLRNNIDDILDELGWTRRDFAIKIRMDETWLAKVHYVPLSEKAIEYINGQKNQLIKEKNPMLVVKELRKADLVFPGQKGQMIKPNSYYHVISRAAVKAGFKASPHCLRHTFVYLNRGTMDLKELQNALGHDESTTTLDIYGDILSDSTKTTAAKIDDVFTKVDAEMEEIEKRKNAKLAKVIQFKKKA